MLRSSKCRSPIWKLCWPSSASAPSSEPHGISCRKSWDRLHEKSSADIFGLLIANSLWADDLTRAIQQRLKDQGFYYGEVDGQGGDETSAAIRRFQIRYGLKVTGQLNDETLRSLGLSRSSCCTTAPGIPGERRFLQRAARRPYYRQPPMQNDGRPLPAIRGSRRLQ